MNKLNLLGLLEQEPMLNIASPMRAPTDPVAPPQQKKPDITKLKMAVQQLSSVASPQAPMSVDEQLGARMRDYLEAQKKGIGSLEQEYAKLEAPQETHPLVSILAGLSDVVGDGKKNNLATLLQSQQAIKSSHQDKKMKYLENIQKARDSYSKEEINWLGKQKEDRDKLKEELMMSQIYKNYRDPAEGKSAKANQDILKTKESQKIQAQINLNNGIKAYEDLINDNGYQMSGVGADKLNSAYADLKIKYKEAANLGALTGPDVSLLMEAIKPTTGVMGGAREFGSKIGVSGGVKGAKEGINQIKGLLNDDYTTTVDALESAFGQNPVIDQYRTKFTAPQKAAAKKAATGATETTAVDPARQRLEELRAKAKGG